MGRPRGSTTPERDREWLERVCDGELMAEVAADAGVSRQRVDQVVKRLAPEKPWKAYAVERRAVRAEVERHRVRTLCVVCDASVTHAGVTCGGRCSELWLVLRYHVDPDRRAKQRAASARYLLRHEEMAGSRTFAVHVLTGDVRERGRWLLAGSAPYEAAVEAYRNGWPIFDRLPAEIRDQIREVVG